MSPCLKHIDIWAFEISDEETFEISTLLCQRPCWTPNFLNSRSLLILCQLIMDILFYCSKVLCLTLKHSLFKNMTCRTRVFTGPKSRIKKNTKSSDRSSLATQPSRHSVSRFPGPDVLRILVLIHSKALVPWSSTEVQAILQFVCRMSQLRECVLFMTTTRKTLSLVTKQTSDMCLPIKKNQLHLVRDADHRRQGRSMEDQTHCAFHHAYAISLA